MSTFSPKTPLVNLIEIAQQCNVSVRDIHAKAKEIGHELKPNAREVENKVAKALIAAFLGREPKKSEPEEKAKAIPKTPSKVKKEAKIVKEKPVKSEPKAKSFVLKTQKKPLEKKVTWQVLEKPKPSSPPKEFVEGIKEVHERKAFKNEEKSNKVKPKKVVIPKPKAPIDTTIADELLGLGENDGSPKDAAEIYDELIEQERQREIVQSQRKRVAGKETSRATTRRIDHEESYQSKYDPNRVVEIPEVITVKEFAEKTGVGAAKVIGELMKNGILANINQQIDFDTAQIISTDLKVRIKKRRSESSAEDLFTGNLKSLLKEDDEAELITRPPIVVVMGHVDHGKTKLLDSIRETDVVSGESGGITQHIGAYQVEKNGKKITFLDTPGHEAFTAMRARGAKVTDIAILVVAADEGVKPQTLEALQHAKDAEVPIIVAINKVDKPNADPERVKGELAGYGLQPEDWGGNIIMVPVSALTKKGIPELLEMILLVAEMENLKANENRKAVGTVIEAHLDQSLGPIATVIINTGTLNLMDNVVVGSTFGRIKVMKDHHGKNLKKAPPSTPVLIAGLTVTPQSGDILHAVEDEKMARLQALGVAGLREAQLREARGVGEIISQISSGQLKQLKLVLKADTKGTLEALKQSISQIKHEDVGVKIILSGVGAVSESDVMMAAASGGIVMGFHTEVNQQVVKLAEREKVEVLRYEVIYKLLDDIKKILTGLLEPEMVEVILGKAEVKKVFLTEKKEMIVGCKVIDGSMVNKVKVRIIRKNEVIGQGEIVSLKKNTETVHEVKENNDCGIRYYGSIPLLEGDVLEAYRNEKRVRTL